MFRVTKGVDMQNDRYLTLEDLEKIEQLETLVEQAEKLFYEKLVSYRNGEISDSELCCFTDEELNVRLQYNKLKKALLSDYDFAYFPFNE